MKQLCGLFARPKTPASELIEFVQARQFDLKL